MSEKSIRTQNITNLHAKIRDDKVAEMDAAEFNKWIDALPVGEFMALLDAPLAPPKRQVPERIEELCKKAILATFDLDKRRSMIILNVVGELRRATAKASPSHPQVGRVDEASDHSPARAESVAPTTEEEA